MSWDKNLEENTDMAKSRRGHNIFFFVNNCGTLWLDWFKTPLRARNYPQNLGFPSKNQPKKLGFPEIFRISIQKTPLWVWVFEDITNMLSLNFTRFCYLVILETSILIIIVLVRSRAFQRYTTCLCSGHFVRVSNRKTWPKIWISYTIFGCLGNPETQ